MRGISHVRKMAVQYAAVCYNSTILSDYASVFEDFEGVIEKVLSRIYSDSLQLTLKVEAADKAKDVHVLSKGQLVFVCVSSKGNGTCGLAYQRILMELETKFIQLDLLQIAPMAEKYALRQPFNNILRQCVEDFNESLQSSGFQGTEHPFTSSTSAVLQHNMQVIAKEEAQVAELVAKADKQLSQGTVRTYRVTVTQPPNPSRFCSCCVIL